MNRPIHALILALAVILSGCADLQVPLTPGLKVAEGTLQVTNLVDAMQTVHGAVDDSSCYSEGGPIAKAFTGTKPSAMGAISFRLGYGVLHWATETWLNANDHPALAWALEAVTIADEGTAVAHNYRVGVRLGAPNVLPADCRHEPPIRAPVRR